MLAFPLHYLRLRFRSLAFEALVFKLESKECAAAHENFCRTVKNSATNPASNTPLSSHTEYWCKRSNATRNGLFKGVAATDPIWTRSDSIRGITTYCEAIVNTIMAITKSVAGRAR